MHRATRATASSRRLSARLLRDVATPFPLLVVALIVVASATPAHAQEPPHWRVFTSSDGLRESWIADVTQGPSGRVWITHGAVDAHTVYDGYNFRRLPTAGASLKLREGPTGQVWALLPGSPTAPLYRGLQLLEGERWTAFPLDALHDGGLQRWQFLPWAADRVLLLTPEAILEFDRGRRTTRVVCRASETTLGRFTDLAPAIDGGAWVGGIGAVLHLEPAGDGAAPRRALTLPPAFRTRRVVKIHDVAGRLFASVDLEQASAALTFDGAQWHELSRTTATGESILAWPGSGGATWLASISPRAFQLTRDAGACCRVDVERTKAFSGRLNAVEPLPDGGFWLATSLGLVRHAPAVWESPSELTRVVAGVGAMLEASTGDLYALHDHGLLRRRNAQWELLPVPAGFIVDSGLASNVAELADGRIVFGVNTTAGFDATLAFEAATARFSQVAHPAGRHVRMLSPATPRGAWVMTSAADQFHLERYDGTQFTSVLDAQSAWAASNPRTVLELGGGDLLVTPDGGGVGWVRGGRHDVIDRSRGYPGAGSFAALHIDGQHIWFGDRDSVLSFDGKRWQTVRAGLQTVRAIVRTRDGSVWVASGSGLHRLHQGGWMTIGAPEGLPDGSVSDVLEDRSGTIWVSTTSGLSRYVAAGDRDAPQTSLDAPGNPTEAPPSGDVRIAFRGRDRWNYSPPERLLFAWRLDGGSWSPPEPREAVALAGLRPGRHRMEVRATDRNWNVDPTPAALEFVVLLPWYRESGFLIVGALASLALLLAAGSFVWRHVRLERLVTDRTTALAQANAQLRFELADRQRIEQDRARLEGQLHQAQKLEAVGRLAGGIAHDFNNLLTVITGFAELLQEEAAAASASMRASIDEIAKAAQRASALTRQVLAFSRQQIIEPKPLDLNTVVADIERMLHRLIGEDIALTFRPGPQLWHVLGDRGQIEQVLVNLAVNARDAMPHGGQLTIDTSNVDLDEAFTRTHAGTRPGPHVLLAVADTGAGMDAETRARIFEPFFTTKGRDKGTGLGLATVYGVVTQAGGHIWVESEPGAGSTFRVYLPRTEAPPDVEAIDAAPQAMHGSETILLVEDDDAVRQVAATALTRLGYTVEVASSAEAALVRLRQPGPAPDLVLTDIVLTGISGVDLASQARQVCPTLRVLFMSGYADSAVIRKGPMTAGAHFIQKPFTADGLGRKVRDAIDAPPLA